MLVKFKHVFYNYSHVHRARRIQLERFGESVARMKRGNKNKSRKCASHAIAGELSEFPSSNSIASVHANFGANITRRCPRLCDAAEFLPAFTEKFAIRCVHMRGRGPQDPSILKLPAASRISPKRTSLHTLQPAHVASCRAVCLNMEAKIGKVKRLRVRESMNWKARRLKVQ